MHPEWRRAAANGRPVIPPSAGQALGLGFRTASWMSPRPFWASPWTCLALPWACFSLLPVSLPTPFSTLPSALLMVPLMCSSVTWVFLQFVVMGAHGYGRAFRRGVSERSSAPAGAEEAREVDNDDRADHGHDDRLDVDAGGILDIEEHPRKEAADKRSNDAQDDRHHGALAGSRDERGDEAGDRADHDPGDDSHRVLPFSPPPPWRMHISRSGGRGKCLVTAPPRHDGPS